MHKPAFTLVLSAVSLLALTACGPTVREVDSDDPEIASTIGGSARDLDRVTSELIQKMLNSPVIAQVNPRTERLIMRVGRIVDDTKTEFPIPELINMIRSELTKAERVLTQETDLEGQTNVEPEFELRGRVSQRNNRAGNETRIDYYIQLRLVELESGLALWEDGSIYTRMANANAVNW